MLIDLNEEQIATVESKIIDFRGRANVLESALGALIVGQKFGWRLTKMVHSPATVKKYEKILGLKFQDVCPERTQQSERSVGLNMAKKLQSFWAVALGKKDVPNKSHLDSG
jgi:hypothetical protein